MRHPRFVPTLLALLACALSPAARAQDANTNLIAPPDPHAPPPLAPPLIQPPDTPAGKALAWLFETIDTAGDAGANFTATDHFTDAFLAQVPADKLATTLGQLRSGLGGFVLRTLKEAGPTALTATCEARGARTMWRISLGVDPAVPHKIDNLLFTPAPVESVAIFKDWSDVDALLKTLGASRSLAIYEVAGDGSRTPVHTFNERDPLPIGSAFKLFVLGALAEWIEKAGDGAPTWNETLTIDEDLKSLPSGVMQNLPRGSEAPLVEFATKMISISDNTAADHIAHRVGREKIEAWYTKRVSPEAAAKTLPFLTTREMFNVKVSMDEHRLWDYAAADTAARRRLLEPGGEIDSETPSPVVAQQWRIPQGVDKVEWFASTEEMCAVMTELWRMSERPPLRQVGEVCAKNRGLPLSDDTWDQVMFKGGSEPGVLNVTWFLQRTMYAKRDVPPKYVVSMSIMDAANPLDENKAIGLAQRVIEFLAER